MDNDIIQIDRPSVKYTKEFFADLIKAQTELEPVQKNATNPYFKSKYATLDDVWEAWRKIGPKYNLILVFPPGKDDLGSFISPTIMHVSGGFIIGKYYLNEAKRDPQGVGSATTYARRYSMQLITGIVGEEDDDGNSAQGKGDKPGDSKQTQKKTNQPRESNTQSKKNISVNAIFAEARRLSVSNAALKTTMQDRFGKSSTYDLKQEEINRLYRMLQRGELQAPASEAEAMRRTEQLNQVNAMIKANQTKGADNDRSRGSNSQKKATR